MHFQKHANRHERSSIAYGGTSAFFPYEDTSAYFEKSRAKIRAQNRESLWENTSAKLLNQLLAISWKLYAGKFGWIPAAFDRKALA